MLRFKFPRSFAELLFPRKSSLQPIKNLIIENKLAVLFVVSMGSSGSNVNVSFLTVTGICPGESTLAYNVTLINIGDRWLIDKKLME